VSTNNGGIHTGQVKKVARLPAVRKPSTAEGSLIMATDHPGTVFRAEPVPLLPLPVGGFALPTLFAEIGR
jgi:hypothetical protein